MNLASIIVALIVGIVFFSIIISEIKKKKRGISSCSCGSSCSGCGNACYCHNNNK